MTAATGALVLRPAPALAYSFQGRSAALTTGGRTVRYEGDATLLLRHLLPLIDGRRSVAELADELGGERLRPAVFRLCAQLVDDAVLFDVDDTGPGANPGGLLAGPAPDGPGARRRITTMRVAGTEAEVAAIAQVAPAHWQVAAATLKEISGVATPDGVCTVVWLNDPNDEQLAEWNETAYHNRQPWLPISHFDGEVAVVGPYVLPKETPCFECYRRRRAARHRLGPDFLDLRRLDGSTLTSAALTSVLAGIAVTLLQDWEALGNPHVPGMIRTVTLGRGLTVDSEVVLRVPRCSACRPGAAVARPTLWSEYFNSEAEETV